MKSKQNKKTQKDWFVEDRRNPIAPSLQAAPETHPAAGVAHQWLTGEGEMTRRIREFDWSKTALGAASLWPASLRAATSICLNSRFPMFIAWGAHRAMLYNDAYIAVLAGKHSGALGRPAQEVWEEIWHILGPHWAHVFDKGEATWAEDLLLMMNRSGYDEETYFTFSYSPIRDETGSVEGMFCACQETTDKVVGERRLRTLRELAAQATLAKSAQEACMTATKTLSDNPFDLPFALLYLSDGSRDRASLAGAAGLEGDGRASPSCVALDGEDSDGWPLGQVLREGAAQCIENLPDRLGSLPAGPWTQPTTRALLLPLQLAAHELPAGVLIAGVSPVRPLDEGYRTFLEVAAGQIASAIANARAYEQERQKAEALTELDRAKTAFFSNVSHEFRTPLTLMLGPVEDLLLRSHTDLSPAAKGQLEVVNRNGLRLLRLVNTLLDFSRIEAGRVQAVFEPTDLAAFTTELASVFRAATERAGLGLRVDCPKLPEAVYVDRDMWEKIVLNLISNAFKFTFEGEIEVSLRAESSNVILTVRDTGVGIPAEEMPRLFERFHRVQNMRSRTHEGSGIGLALVQELVKLHGGSIRAESRLGKGTSFIVTVPLGAKHLPANHLGSSRSLASTAVGAVPFVEEALRWLPEAAPVEAATLSPSHHELMPIPCPPGEGDDVEGRPRIVIADDNVDMRHYLVRMLRERYSVETVPDGQAALAAARERRPDLILSDVIMPNLDGFGLVRELRADSDLKTIPIILLSARAGEESRVEGLQQGADDYLVKPFSARELMARVAAHLDLARVRKQSGEAIRASELKYRTLFENMTEMCQILEPIFNDEGKVIDFRYIEVNKATENLTGKKGKEIEGKTAKELWGVVESYWIEMLGKVLRTGEPARMENYSQELDTYYDLYAWKANEHRVAIVFSNITERQRAEEALRESEKRYRTLVDNSQDIIVRFDKDYRHVFVNPKASEVTGLSPDQMLGKSNAELGMPQGNVREWHEHFRQVFESKQPVIFEFYFDGPTGQRYFTSLLVPELSEETGEVKTVQAITRDITDHKRAEEALRKAAAELERSNKDLESFAQVASHDLQEPLRMVTGFLSLLEKRYKGQLDAKAHEYIGFSVDGAKRMSALIKDLLEYSRVSAKGQQPVPVDMAAVVDYVKGNLKVAIEESNAVITTDPLPAVMVDEMQMRQLFQNLIGNAVKFRRDGVNPEIHIGVAKGSGVRRQESGGRRQGSGVIGQETGSRQLEAAGPADRTEMGIKRQPVAAQPPLPDTRTLNPDTWLFSVRDNGIGIFQDVCDRIFTIVQRLHTREQYPGTGIGLAICKKIVERHGGRTWVESKPNGGSTFFFTIPTDRKQVMT